MVWIPRRLGSSSGLLTSHDTMGTVLPFMTRLGHIAQCMVTTLQKALDEIPTIVTHSSLPCGDSDRKLRGCDGALCQPKLL